MNLGSFGFFPPYKLLIDILNREYPLDVIIMKFSSFLKTSLASLLVALGAAADVIETKDGARLVGTVKGINGGKITLGTSYAGDIMIDQAEVVSLTMEDALAIRLDDGTTMEGTIAPSGSGEIAIAGSAGSVTAPVTGVAATWSPGDIDPAVKALQRKWSYEAALDITGKTGNADNFGTAISIFAVLEGAEDRLAFYGIYDQQESEGVTSADQFRAGVDYTNSFRGDLSWYVRNEAGFDYIKDIDFFNVAGAGLGYQVINQDHQKLTFRGGLSFRFETYGDGLTDDLQSGGLDFGLNHTYEWETVKMRNSLTFVPSFEDFADFRATHDTHVELPLQAGSWRIRLGVSNDFRSEPPGGLKEMDTTWYTRLVLSWD